MLRWLGFGVADVKQPEKHISKPVKKPPVLQWLPDGQGGYAKVGLSTTATALHTLIKDSQPVTNELSTLLLGAAYELGKAETLADDNNNDTLPVDQNQDALGNFQEDLKRKAGALQVSLDQWEKLKIEIISEDTGLLQYANIKVNVGYNVFQGLTAFFANVFEKIKVNLEPANNELHDLLKITHDAVQDLCLHLMEASNNLKDKSKSEDERRRICIDICNTSMKINEELILMIENIQVELSYCLKCEKMTEQAVKHVAQLVILMVTKIPMPDFDFNFSEAYRNFLYNEIEKEKIEIQQFESDVMGALRRVMNEIKKQKVEWIEAKKKPAETTDNKESINGSQSLLLLPAQKQTQETEQPTSEPLALAAMSM